MAFIKNQPSLLLFLVTILSLHTLTSQLRHHPAPPTITTSSRLPPFLLPFIPYPSAQPQPLPIAGGGEWKLLQQSVGVSAMHMQLLRNNKVVIFDRTDFGASNLTLPPGKCRDNDEAISEDCSAHSLLYDTAFNTYRPLTVQTNVWCSSGAVDPNGTLVQTGGYHAGDHKIRLFAPCDDDQCDWIELPQNLTVQRWYASDQILPDGRVIIVGGRSAFNYEFFPRSDGLVFDFPFLRNTTDPEEENNLYPFLHLLPDGNLFVFANKRSVILDYVKNKIVRKLPSIPGEKRSYPATGSSVMLPLKLYPGGESPAVELMVCGGANGGAYLKAVKGIFLPASKTCGRIRVTDSKPKWVMEDMPTSRVMPDMLLLPTGDVIILNGAVNGTGGWECAEGPVLEPFLYRSNEHEPSRRFTVLNPTTIARMYHSTAILLPDGRVLVGGSNPHVSYNFTGVKYATELSLEAFAPPYMAVEYDDLRPSILSVESDFVSYGLEFAVTFSFGLGMYEPVGECMVTMVAPSFTTHSYAMNQRLLVLPVVEEQQLSEHAYELKVLAPPNANVAPPGYYMLFVVHHGVPSHSVWIRMK